MNNEQLIESVVREVLNSMEKGITTKSTKQTSSNSNISIEDYPFGKKIPDKVKTHSGKKLSELTLEKAINGEVKNDDLKVSKETLDMQAEVAEKVNRKALADNFRRAAELIEVPDERILEIYGALRPYRSTKQELLDIADELEKKYNCKINSEFVREAAEVYEKRGRLKK
ncbi:MAG: diol dehydratase small subunit [Tissierellales bacterium]|jgi:propanediol dehydratase small subunit|nr:diol dehydratase small subunit [Tissierellales bacterium]HCX05092.1 propanediol dehydratase small subunit PduE [Clostridiales bacterium]